MKAQRTHEFRCPVHGFVTLSDWEREIVAQPAFQRLRRIRQLAWTDQVYPGAMHTRFEYSLGVMHVATRMYDAVARSSRELLADSHGYDQAGLDRDRILVRLTALLHDVGHAPFSHAAEELFPFVEPDGRRYHHEEYSSTIIRECLRDAIENHPANQNYRISANEIAALLEGSNDAGRALSWRELISGQMDADRIDYLSRDSLHSGVQYGRFDIDRLIVCLTLVPETEGRGFRLGITEGGFHSAEALVLARYFMFTQVYFHKTRVAFDHHLQQALKEIVPGGTFPAPNGAGLNEFLKWDDWRVLGALSSGQGGEHGCRLAERNHFREVYHTPEVPTAGDNARFEKIRAALGDLARVVVPAEKSWYKVENSDIPVRSSNPGRRTLRLSRISSVISGMRPVRKRMMFCRPEEQDEATRIVERVEGRKQ